MSNLEGELVITKFLFIFKRFITKDCCGSLGLIKIKEGLVGWPVLRSKMHDKSSQQFPTE